MSELPQRPLEQPAYDELAALRDFEAIDVAAQREGVAMHVSDLEPIAVSGQFAMVAAIKAGMDGEWQVWTSLDSNNRPTSKHVMITDRQFDALSDQPQEFVPIPDNGEEQLLGRTELGKGTGLMTPSVSRRHAGILLTPDGTLTIHDKETTNGTRLVAKRQSVSVNEDTLKREVLPTNNIEDGISSEPGYLALRKPFDDALASLDKRFRPRITQLNEAIRVQESYGQYGAPESLKDEARTLTEQYYAEVRAQRRELEMALKPYIRERLAAVPHESVAGYSKPGALQVEGHRIIRTARGKQIAHYVPGGAGGRGFFTDTGVVRLGQLHVGNSRMGSWAGSNAGKSNHLTGHTTTSSEHIVDLAAAMAAGTMGAEHDPISIARDEHAEYDLPRDLQGKIKLYRVTLGFHRMAALRLLNGNDAPVGAVDIQEK